MRVAVLNSGSSSIKYQVFDMTGPTVLAAGLIERIGEPDSRLEHRSGQGGDEQTVIREACGADDHRAGFRLMLELLGDPKALDAIGHRVVHGGEEFQEPTRITEAVLETIREQEPLAPLHNPANMVGIEAALAACPDTPQVAVFDTAFHQSMPPQAYTYALPWALYAEHRVRRYGFHGTSHRFVAGRASEILGVGREDFNGIILHLGNGASVSAVRNGQSVDTSMGLTPLEGLVMGSRCGDVDPALHAFLQRTLGMRLAEIDDLLNRESGLKGLCGDNDMRAVQARRAEGDERASLAFDIFCYRARKYVGAYLAVLGRVDAVVFTAGIGEHSPEVRAAIVSGLDALGISLDEARNAAPGDLPADVSSADSATRILVVPTNEELEIARQTAACLGGG